MGVWSEILDTIPALVEAGSTYYQNEARQDALDNIGDVAAGNVDFIAEMGEKGASEIDQALLKAIQYDPANAAKYIQMYADTGGEAFKTATENIMTGKDVSPYTEAIAGAGAGAVTGRQEFQNMDPAIMAAIGKESGYTGSSYQPAMNQALLGIGQQGQQAAGDIAGIGMRKSGTFGDMERQAALSKANIIMGNVAPTLNQMQTGQDVRLLSNISQSNMIKDLLGQGAYYSGSQSGGN